MRRRDGLFFIVGYVQERENTLYSSIRTKEKDYSAIVGYVEKRRNICS